MFVSIQNKIIVLLIAFTLLPFVILKIVAFPRVELDVEEMQVRHLESLGHRQTVLVSNWMHERMIDAIVVAGNPYIVDSVNLTRSDSTYEETLRYMEMIVAE
ncbi:MAG: PAS domain S-box protein, partial [Planctomycetes bacterium]|nr:PAS domain S-box protein [Planctomycetota bacterium]